MAKATKGSPKTSAGQMLSASSSGSPQGSAPSWEDANNDPRLGTLVALLTAHGGAVLLGMVRDRTALTVTLYEDDGRDTWYFGDVEAVFRMIEILEQER